MGDSTTRSNHGFMFIHCIVVFVLLGCGGQLNYRFYEGNARADREIALLVRHIKTFNGSKVIKVKESYAGLGAEAAAPTPIN